MRLFTQPAASEARRHDGFTLVEILIVVMIVGILAAIVVPQFSQATDNSRQAALGDQLRIYREQISVFRAEHNETWPGMSGGAVGTDALFISQLTTYTDPAGSSAGAHDATHKFGPYLPTAPVNPISGSGSVLIDTSTVEPTPDNTTGWIYQPLTGRLYANLTAQDSNGKAFFNY